jgi:Tol biopolymer transport system component
MKRKITIYALMLLLGSLFSFSGRQIGQAQQTSKAEYYSPRWSPDGKRITFSVYKGKRWDLYMVNADSSNLRRLTDDSADGNSAAWSPNGKKIAFASKRAGNTDIYIMSADKSNLVQLTSNVGKLNGGPSWSPDGKKIAFVSNRDGHFAQIYVMNADGSNQTRLTNNSAAEFGPEWSPDGKRIIFESNRDNGDIDEIYVMNADGSNQTRITNRTPDGFNNIYPTWVPKTNRISFSSFGKDKIINVYMADPDGSNLSVLIDHASYARWSPKGAKVVYLQKAQESPQIFVMNADGSNRVQLTK